MTKCAIQAAFEIFLFGIGLRFTTVVSSLFQKSDWRLFVPQNLIALNPLKILLLHIFEIVVRRQGGKWQILQWRVGNGINHILSVFDQRRWRQISSFPGQLIIPQTCFTSKTLSVNNVIVKFLWKVWQISRWRVCVTYRGSSICLWSKQMDN